MRYLPKSESERRKMLEACGVSTPEELFAHLPDAVRLNRPLNLAPGISEYEIVQYFRERADQREQQDCRPEDGQHEEKGPQSPHQRR